MAANLAGAQLGTGELQQCFFKVCKNFMGDLKGVFRDLEGVYIKTLWVI